MIFLKFQNNLEFKKIIQLIIYRIKIIQNTMFIIKY